MAAAVVSVAVVLAVAWLWISSSLAEQVHVLLPAGTLSCDGTDVTLDEVPATVGEDVMAPVAMISEDMRCILDVRIENRSRSSVAVAEIFVDVLGPRAGPESGPWLLPTRPSSLHPNEIDAIFGFADPYPLPAGSAASFGVVLEWRPDGCTSDGGTLTFRDQPRVTLSVLGTHHEAAHVGTAFGFRGSPASSCDE